MNINTPNGSAPIPCDHWPPMVAVISTVHGYKVRCLTCGHTGPERESTNLAWMALLRSREEAGEARDPGASASYQTVGRGSGDPKR